MGRTKWNREFFASNPAKVAMYSICAESGEDINLEISATRKDNRSGRGVSFCDRILAEENQYIWLEGSSGGKMCIRDRDTRAQDICDELNERIGKDRIFKLCGNSLQPSYTTPKIVWYQRNLPEVYAKTAKILQSNSYIAFKLTGKMTQDVSQGYGCLLYTSGISKK